VSKSNKGFGVLSRLFQKRAASGNPPANLKAATDAAYLAEIQNLTQTGSLAWNFATGSIHWSAETYRICGVDPAAPLSRDLILNLVHREDVKAFNEAVQFAINGRARFDHELRLVRADGQTRTVHMVGRFLAEKPEQFVGAITDATERRLEEEARRTSDFHYRNMFVALAAAFWELDFSGVTPILKGLRQQGIKDLTRYFADNPEVVREMMRATRVINVNDQTVALFGRGAKEELLTNVEPFWADSSLQVYAASVIASMRRAPGFSAETRLRRIDGTEFDGLFTVSFPPEGVATSKFLIAVIDISERVNAQAALRNLQAELAHAARLSTLGELAASIAHEVNQPLAAITTNASASVRWLDRPEPNLEEVKTLAARIAADARRAADIIARIRDMATRRTTETAPLSVASVIEEAAAFLRHDMQAQRVSLVLDLAPDLPVVIGDRTQIQQVVVNLAMNAAQAMAQATTGQRRIIIGAHHLDGNVVVTIDDDGPGIPQEHLDRLFQSFFTTKENGMGIGLPICRTIVEAHGGQIRIENRASGGARVTVSLPVKVTTGTSPHTNV
jgi:signal transduction histidine kinase